MDDRWRGRSSAVRVAFVLSSLPVFGIATLEIRAANRPVNAEAPPLRHTGGFGEPTCQACHTEYPINLPGGAVALDGVPGLYDPGRTYTITVVLGSEDMGRAGFEVAVRYLDGPKTGEQAGRVEPIDGRVVVTRDSSTRVDFVHHSAIGSAVVGDGSQMSWAFRWTAPASVAGSETVVFHVAANSANGDNSPLGDLVYTADLQSQRAKPSR